MTADTRKAIIILRHIFERSENMKYHKLTENAVKPDGKVTPFQVSLGDLTPDERQIIADGCLINYYRNHPVD